MKITRVDASRFYAEGGYFDVCAEKYITPQWLSDRDSPENEHRVGMFYTGLSAEDYAEIEANTRRYLRMPIICPDLVFRIVAERLQVPAEIFYLMGFDDAEHLRTFLSYEETAEIRKNGYSIVIANARDAFVQYARFHDRYWDYVKVVGEVEREFIEQWLAEHNIEFAD